jgi:hypothetical protein
MEFCSKYGYDYGFQGSDEEYLDDDNNKKKQNKVRKVDSNIIAFKFDDLNFSNELFPGSIISCLHCSAIRNYYSLSDIKIENSLLWICEFCGNRNEFKSI